MQLKCSNYQGAREKIEGGQKMGTNKDSSGLANSSLLGRGRNHSRYGVGRRFARTSSKEKMLLPFSRMLSVVIGLFPTEWMCDWTARLTAARSNYCSM